MLDWKGDQLTGTNLKPRFQWQFAMQSDDKLIIDGHSNLAMKPNKSTGELLARITNTMVIIKESYMAYENKVAAPANHDTNRGYLEATATKWRNDSVNNTMQFFKMHLFRAALPGDICKIVAQHDQNTMTLDDMYQIATPTQREARAKLAKSITAVDEDTYSDTDDEDDKVVAFQNRKSSKFANKGRKQLNAQMHARQFQSRQGSGNNFNRNRKYCFYCKIQNHTQEECCKRIRENKPCRDKQGCAYWPKVYVTSNSNQSERDQQGQQQGFHS